MYVLTCSTFHVCLIVSIDVRMYVHMYVCMYVHVSIRIYIYSIETA